MTNIPVTSHSKIAFPRLGDHVFRVLMIFPALLMLAVFMFYPIFETFRLSLTNSSALGATEYIGMNNYFHLFRNADFLAGLSHTVQWAFFSVIIQVPLSFFIAFACVMFKTPVIRWLRSVYYLGNVIPVAIVCMIALFILGPNTGALVTLANTLDWKWLANIDFIGNAKNAFPTLFTVATWAYIGFGIVYLMACIDQIPAELSEAAMIDGANKWQLAWHVVLPQVSYAVRIQALLAVVGSIRLFELPWLITVGGPGNSTTTLGIELYKQGFLNWQYGIGAAIGVIIFLLSLGFTVLQFSLKTDSE